MNEETLLQREEKQELFYRLGNRKVVPISEGR